ncbi:hypothetical protein C8J57DRAFT_1563711 [Mycena rebaudengoi]|nr:hypothetical protein C8J57DRAFT_1563711 [Mycena rebaudengoi]
MDFSLGFSPHPIPVRFASFRPSFGQHARAPSPFLSYRLYRPPPSHRARPATLSLRSFLPSGTRDHTHWRSPALRPFFSPTPLFGLFSALRFTWPVLEFGFARSPFPPISPLYRPPSFLPARVLVHPSSFSVLPTPRPVHFVSPPPRACVILSTPFFTFTFLRFRFSVSFCYPKLTHPQLPTQTQIGVDGDPRCRGEADGVLAVGIGLGLGELGSGLASVVKPKPRGRGSAGFEGRGGQGGAFTGEGVRWGWDGAGWRCRRGEWSKEGRKECGEEEESRGGDIFGWGGRRGRGWGGGGVVRAGGGAALRRRRPRICGAAPSAPSTRNPTRTVQTTGKRGASGAGGDSDSRLQRPGGTPTPVAARLRVVVRERARVGPVSSFGSAYASPVGSTYVRIAFAAAVCVWIASVCIYGADTNTHIDRARARAGCSWGSNRTHRPTSRVRGFIIRRLGWEGVRVRVGVRGGQSSSKSKRRRRRARRTPP